MTDKLHSLRPNPRGLVLRLEEAMRRSDRSGAQLALLVVRVQRGAELVALHGAQQFAAVLEEVTLRMAEVCRKDDRVVRIGDAEVALVLEGLLNEGHAQLAAVKAQRLLAQPFLIGAASFLAETRVGIALHPDHATKPQRLLQCAEAALADAEAHGEPFRVYDQRIASASAASWELENELGDALQTGQFEVHFQPKLDLRTRRVAGAEALLRWRSPTRGMVPPDAFIPIATRTGLIKALTWSSLNMALEHAVRWPTRYGPMSLAVNISPALLEDDSIVGQLVDALGIWDAAPERVVVEITESAAMRDPESCYETIRALRAAGLRVSIDDFGTGYSSFAQFRRIPANEIKIDRSFISAMMRSPTDAGIVRSIIGLAQAADLDVVAEGVEDPQLLDLLGALGCGYAQGYCISAALPPAEFVRFVIEHQPDGVDQANAAVELRSLELRALGAGRVC